MDVYYHIDNRFREKLGRTNLVRTEFCLGCVKIEAMGRIVANVRIGNLHEPSRIIQCDAFVDTRAANMILPKAWLNRLGRLTVIREFDCKTITQDIV